MKHWRALGRGRRIYYLVTMLLPLAEISPVLISLSRSMIRSRALPPLDGLWLWLALSAPGILLGAVSLVRTLAGHPPKDLDSWDNLLIFTYFPDLFLLVMDMLVFWFVLVMAFSGH